MGWHATATTVLTVGPPWALAELAGREANEDVVLSIARALMYVRDPIAIPVSVAFAANERSDVRLRAAMALPAAMSEGDDDAGVDALIQLSGDADAETRNWATFGLGRQVAADGRRVRGALWARVDDDDADVREGICGLARRHEGRVLPFLADLLAGGDVHVWLFDAAACLGDESLVSVLERYDRGAARRAVRECDPARRSQRDLACQELLGVVQAALDDAHPGVGAAVFCELWGFDATPLLQIGGGDPPVWSVEFLIDSTGGDIESAVAKVLTDFSRLG